jgi:hypothetical protein
LIGHAPAYFQGWIFFGPYAAPVNADASYTAAYLRILANHMRALKAGADNPTSDIADASHPDHEAWARLQLLNPVHTLVMRRRAYITSAYEARRWPTATAVNATGTGLTTPGTAESATQIITDIARLLLVSPSTVWTYITKDFGSQGRVRASLPPAGQRLSRATPALDVKFSVIKAVFDSERSNRKAYRAKFLKAVAAGEQHMMRPPLRPLAGCTLHALKRTDVPNDDGYPTHCPVTGTELDWTPGCRSMAAPRIILRSELTYSGEPAPADITQDIMIVAKVVKR